MYCICATPVFKSLFSVNSYYFNISPIENFKSLFLVNSYYFKTVPQF